MPGRQGTGYRRVRQAGDRIPVCRQAGDRIPPCQAGRGPDTGVSGRQEDVSRVDAPPACIMPGKYRTLGERIIAVRCPSLRRASIDPNTTHGGSIESLYQYRYWEPVPGACTRILYRSVGTESLCQCPYRYSVRVPLSKACAATVNRAEQTGDGCNNSNISNILTRALLGGAFERPLRFSRIAKNGGAQRRRVFTPPYPHLFRNFCENFDPMPCEVRSPGACQVTQLQNNFPIAPRPQRFRESYETFGI